MNLVRMLATAALVAALAAGVAAADNPRFRLVAADQKAARAVVLTQADLPVGWTGGILDEPDLEGFSCPGYTQADLVVTGAAESSFESSVGRVDSFVWVMRTPEMVQRDLKRLAATQELRCVRSDYEQADAAVRVVSVARLAFPRVAPRTKAIRVVYDYTAGGRTVRYVDDTIQLFDGRLEVGLVVGARYADRGAARTFEIWLARILARRAAPPPLLAAR